MKTGTTKQKGFTLPELLVGVTLFGVVGLGLLNFVNDALRSLSVESRAALAALELNNTMGLISSELRMSSSVSPYLVGNDETVVTCSNALAISSTSIRFLVVEDDPSSATSGLQPYYVGYIYNSATKELRRGEIAGTTVTNCTLPAGNPTSNSISQLLAENIVPVDINDDGTDEPLFNYDATTGTLTLTLGVEVKSGKRTVVQAARTRINLRT